MAIEFATELIPLRDHVPVVRLAMATSDDGDRRSVGIRINWARHLVVVESDQQICLPAWGDHPPVVAMPEGMLVVLIAARAEILPPSVSLAITYNLETREVSEERWSQELWDDGRPRMVKIARQSIELPPITLDTASLPASGLMHFIIRS